MSEQLTFDLPARRRDMGMGLASDAEDREQPTFADATFEAIRTVAMRQATVHVDDVLAVCTVKPHHPNAFGAVWMRAIRARMIERTGSYRPSTDIKKNAHQYPVYRSLIVAGAERT